MGPDLFACPARNVHFALCARSEKRMAPDVFKKAQEADKGPPKGPNIPPNMAPTTAAKQFPDRPKMASRAQQTAPRCLKRGPLSPNGPHEGPKIPAKGAAWCPTISVCKDLDKEQRKHTATYDVDTPIQRRRLFSWKGLGPRVLFQFCKLSPVPCWGKAGGPDKYQGREGPAELFPERAPAQGSVLVV